MRRQPRTPDPVFRSATENPAQSPPDAARAGNGAFRLDRRVEVFVQSRPRLENNHILLVNAPAVVVFRRERPYPQVG